MDNPASTSCNEFLNRVPGPLISLGTHVWMGLDRNIWEISESFLTGHLVPHPHLFFEYTGYFADVAKKKMEHQLHLFFCRGSNKKRWSPPPSFFSFVIPKQDPFYSRKEGFPPKNANRQNTKDEYQRRNQTNN
jgi:hypothetical protein